MLRVLSMVSGGGTNLQAIIDSVKNGMITNTELVGVISNNKNAYALTRAKENGIDAKCISHRFHFLWHVSVHRHSYYC